MVKPKIHLLKPNAEKKVHVYSTGLTDKDIEERQDKVRAKCRANLREKKSMKYVWLSINNTTKEGEGDDF